MRSIAKTHLPRFLTPASHLLQDFAASLDALARFSSAARAASAAAPSLATSAAPPAAGAPPGVIPPHMPPGMAEAHLALVEQVGVGVGVCVCVCVCVYVDVGMRALGVCLACMQFLHILCWLAEPLNKYEVASSDRFSG